jgi:hypothetical protein
VLKTDTSGRSGRGGFSLIWDSKELDVELDVELTSISNADQLKFNIYLLHQLKSSSTSLAIEIRSISASECVHVPLAVEAGKRLEFRYASDDSARIDSNYPPLASRGEARLQSPDAAAPLEIPEQ